jgi:hypothetical protein
MTMEIGNESEYRKAEGVNWSNLKWIKKSPADYLYNLENPTVVTDSMRLGNYVDCALLTPNELPKRYKVSPPLTWKTSADKDTTVLAYHEALGFSAEEIPTLIKMKLGEFKDYIQQVAAKNGITFIPQSSESKSNIFNEQNAKAMIAAQKGKPLWADLMGSMEASQKPLYATCPQTGLKLKGLADILTTNCLGDLKTISDMDRRFWQIRDMMYVNQLAYYDYLLRLNGISKIEFFLLFIETKPPYKMKLVQVERGAIEKAHQENLGMLRSLKQCLDTGYFPDSSDEKDTYHEFEKVETPEDAEWLESQMEGQDSL